MIMMSKFIFICEEIVIKILYYLIVFLLYLCHIYNIQTF